MEGVDEGLLISNKIITFTFDAYEGKNANGNNAELINFIQKQKIPDTLFVIGKWIDANYSKFVKLSKDPNFEIQYHRFNSQSCSVVGESEYGIHGTKDIPAAIDEIEDNA